MTLMTTDRPPTVIRILIAAAVGLSSLLVLFAGSLSSQVKEEATGVESASNSNTTLIELVQQRQDGISPLDWLKEQIEASEKDGDGDTEGDWMTSFDWRLDLTPEQLKYITHHHNKPPPASPRYPIRHRRSLNTILFCIAGMCRPAGAGVPPSGEETTSNSGNGTTPETAPTISPAPIATASSSPSASSVPSLAPSTSVVPSSQPSLQPTGPVGVLCVPEECCFKVRSTFPEQFPNPFFLLFFTIELAPNIIVDTFLVCNVVLPGIDFPTEAPSNSPSKRPSEAPSTLPSTLPSDWPSVIPSVVPSTAPTTSSDDDDSESDDGSNPAGWWGNIFAHWQG